MKPHRAAWVVLLCFVAAANAQQVYRCTDNGRTTYSQTPCDTDAQTINARPNSIDTSESHTANLRRIQESQERAQMQHEAAQERNAGYRAENAARETQQRSAEKDKRRIDAFETAMTPYPGARHGMLTASQLETATALARTERERARVKEAASKPHPGTQALTSTQLDTLRRLAESSPGQKPPPARRTVAQEPAPLVVIDCDGGFCYDNQGGVYHSVGDGQTFTGPSGGTCQLITGMMHC